MDSSGSQTYSSTGKWILGGEHAVLRGSEALVFPLPTLETSLIYEPSEKDLSAHFSGITGGTYQILFYGLVDRAMEILGRSRSALKGTIHLASNLPLGNGLGASAALCVVVGKWLSKLGWLPESQLESFCRELENLFHGESSGVDVAVILSGHPLVFSRGKGSEPLLPLWKPALYLSPSGQNGLTHSCVERVKMILQQNPPLGQKLDGQMAEAVQTMKKVLLETERRDSLEVLAGAIDEANACFQAWGLTEGVLDRERKLLLEAGALAAKPTGSGAGGFMLSLWKDTTAVPGSLKDRMIPVWKGTE